MKKLRYEQPKSNQDLWAHVQENITPFGWVVKRLLLTRNFTQSKLAEKLGIAESNLSCTLRGKKDRPLSDALVKKISEALRLSSDEQSMLTEAANLSKLTLTLNNAPPWKYALAARFHLNLLTMEPYAANAIDLILTHDLYRQTSKVKCVRVSEENQTEV